MDNLAVVGLQWGDEGKGKLVDYLADDHDAVVRFNGGSNAGHTVVIGDKKYTFHLVPSGALKGKELLIGAGVVLDPDVLREELALLPAEARKKLLVDRRTSLVSPLDKQLDKSLEEMREGAPIGTTRRGIGPAYAMRALRLSPRVGDLIDGFDFAPASAFYSKFGLDPTPLASWASASKSLLSPSAGDVALRVSQLNDAGKSVLFETSQGTLLDVVHGSYPYVTSTHTVVSYIPAALGLPASTLGSSVGVMKCYTTRVGGGPFPTEEAGTVGEKIRSLGNEYGATTGRPRRVGWLDLVALRYAIKLNGVTKVAVSKLDVLSGVSDFKACIAYNVNGSETSDFQEALSNLGKVTPVYESPFTLEGSEYDGGLPPQAQKFVEYVEAKLKVEVTLVSHGEERTRTIRL